MLSEPIKTLFGKKNEQQETKHCTTKEHVFAGHRIRGIIATRNAPENPESFVKLRKCLYKNNEEEMKFMK
ncbi:hypothetical protein NECAME_11579 [Necator americanus]|uniref:Uncharacterized protein n=1 Tax=Necator americanus TaxID=51031 RepID=W2T4R7_NECAM|nr:hypothetical protein NECAME_11579 [Necator americanus]ETN76574.1 hypothetical protein NECAME_11579 [Necator americanus]